MARVQQTKTTNAPSATKLRNMNVDDLLVELTRRGLDATKAPKAALLLRLGVKAPVARKPKAKKAPAPEEDMTETVSEASAETPKAKGKKAKGAKKGAKASKGEKIVVVVPVAAPEKVAEGDLAQLKVPDLRKMLRDKHLSTAGKKADLIARLNGETSTPKKRAGRPKGVRKGQGKVHQRGMTLADAVRFVKILEEMGMINPEDTTSIDDIAARAFTKFGEYEPEGSE